MNVTCFATMEQGYQNKNGVSCGLRNPHVLVRFRQQNLAFITKIQVQREHDTRPGNVQQIEAVFLNANNSVIKDEITNEPIKWISPENNPTIKGYFQDVTGLMLKVLRTDNNDTVKNFRLNITGCHSLGL